MLATDEAIEGLLTTGRQEWKSVHSAHGKGLYIRLQASGRKLWFYRYTEKGKRVDIEIGEFPTMKLSGALTAHHNLIKRRENNEDLAAVFREDRRQRALEQRQAQTRHITNQQLFEDWVTIYAKRPSLKTRRVPSKRTVDAALYRWNRYVPNGFKQMYAGETSKTDVNKVISKAATKAREESRKLSSNLTMMFDHAEDIGVVKETPVVNLKPARLGATSSLPGERHLSLKETKALVDFLLKHTHILGYDRRDPPSKTSETLALAILMLIFTGQRRSEVMNAKWSEFNLKERLWVIPPERHKSRRGHRIYLSDTPLAIITRANALCGHLQNYVFDTGRHTSDENRRGDTINRVLKRMLNNGELKGHVGKFSPHDLRRTFATLAGDHVGGAEDVIKRVLGQVSSDKLVVTYQRAKKWKAQVEIWEAMDRLLI